MKKLLMTLLMTLIILQGVKSVELISLPKNPPDWWNKLTDQEKYEYFKKAHEISVNQNKLLQQKIEQDKSEIEQDQKNIEVIKENKEFLKKYNPYHPNFAFDIGLNFLIAKEWKTNLQVKLGFYKFWLNGRMFINPEILVQFREEFGIGAGLSLGFTFQK